jgi:hypothetical protein
MFDSEFSDKIRITKSNGESIELDQRRVKIRENKNGLMAVSYLAPVFEIMDVEDFFEDMLSSEKLTMNISDTGDFKVSFRGIVDGKGKALPQNLDHKIILLQEPICPESIMDVQLTGFSRFRVRDENSDS